MSPPGKPLPIPPLPRRDALADVQDEAAVPRLSLFGALRLHTLHLRGGALEQAGRVGGGLHVDLRGLPAGQQRLAALEGGAAALRHALPLLRGPDGGLGRGAPLHLAPLLLLRRARRRQRRGWAVGGGHGARRTDAALAAVGGYCRMRTVEQLAAELLPGKQREQQQHLAPAVLGKADEAGAGEDDGK
ncbi:hypothetical protein TSOC_013406 [Tetrabaena socialis]|uniref:Uncharacterized protein n=1 Tax=Tetrabaena socialis TaxID=47790 RepID=A0A2J7ZKF9_9CHLO|nr:hypothetical protein TSOC_013406 [Tetrabaena socialis]|eukprot:PNH00752.1 hypothetical protein TSOC_013406 [Tetrabaena socialis]